MPSNPVKLREAGRRAAELAWQAVDKTPIELADPLAPDFAVAALDRLEQLQREAPGVMKRILEGSERGAEGLNADPLAEVVQNADDAQAREVRIAVLDSVRPTLLMAHTGGERVRIDHVLPMSFAFLSTKRGSVGTTGKFGVGLKALNPLGDRLEVHCPPYAFAVEGSRINTDARDLALQVALLVALLASLLGVVNSLRMMRLPDPAPSAAAEGMALG